MTRFYYFSYIFWLQRQQHMETTAYNFVGMDSLNSWRVERLKFSCLELRFYPNDNDQRTTNDGIKKLSPTKSNKDHVPSAHVCMNKKNIPIVSLHNVCVR